MTQSRCSFSILIRYAVPARGRDLPVGDRRGRRTLPVCGTTPDRRIARHLLGRATGARYHAVEAVPGRSRDRPEEIAEDAVLCVVPCAPWTRRRDLECGPLLGLPHVSSSPTGPRAVDAGPGQSDNRAGSSQRGASPPSAAAVRAGSPGPAFRECIFSFNSNLLDLSGAHT
jgi:hypothetical protein